MNSGMKSLLWSAAALLLLISVIVPALNMLTIAVMMVPFTALYATVSGKAFALHVIPVFVIAYLILGPAALILGLFFLVPSIVMGQMYRRKAQARTVLTVVILAFLGQFLLEMLLFSAALNISLTGEMSNMVHNMLTDLKTQGLLPANWTGEMTDLLIRNMVQSIPLVLIVLSFLLAVVGHWLARALLIRWHGLDIPGLKPAKEWMMPKIFVFYYLIALVLELIVSKENDSFLNTALINLVPLLRMVFMIQTIGFFFFLADRKRWKKIVPVLLSVPLFLFPPLSLIGVLDVAFPIRKSIKKP